MQRLIAVVCACAVSATLVVSAQTRGGGQGRSGGSARQGGSAPARNGGGGEQSQEMKDARAQLQKDIAESKRLMEQLKRDREAKNRSAVESDNAALKAIREAIKRDQEHIKQLVNGRGRGRGAL